MKLRNKLIATIISISMVLAVIGIGAWASVESFTATITNTVNLEFDNLSGNVVLMAAAGVDNAENDAELPFIGEQVLYYDGQVVYDRVSSSATQGTNLYWEGTKFLDSSNAGLNLVNSNTESAVLVYGFIYSPTEDCVGTSTITAMVTQTSLPVIAGGQLIVKYFASTDMASWTEMQSGVPITPVNDNEQLIVMAVCQYYNPYGASITTSASAWDFNVAFSAGRAEKAPLTGRASMDIWNFSTGVILPYDHGNDGSTLQSIELRGYASNATSVTFDYYNDEYKSIISGVTPTAVDVYGTGSINQYVVGTEVYFLSDGKIYAAANCSHMFSNLTSLISIQFKNFDTSKVTDMNNMFFGCNSLTTLDVSSFDTSKVTDMSSMFCDCRALTTLDLSNFDTSKVTTMSSMFYNCGVLTTLDLSNFDTSSVTDMNNMFTGCNALTTLDLSSFDTSKVTDMNNMFFGCNSLTTLDLSSFDTSKVTDMSTMFLGCSDLTTLDLSSFDTSKVTDMYSMFYRCNALTTIYVSDAWSTTNVTTSSEMFYACTKLVGGNGTTYNSSYTDKTYARIDTASTPGYFTAK